MQTAENWLELFGEKNESSAKKAAVEQMPLLFPEQSSQVSAECSLQWRRSTIRFDAAPLSADDLGWVWQSLVKRYFPDRADLLAYRLRWSSRRQKRTLASCNVKLKRVTVARELNRPELFLWLDPLLYHEMCHAVIGFDLHQRGKRTPWHGKEFRALEKRHPGVQELDAWIAAGGWAKAVRSSRAREAYRRRRRA